MNDEDIEEGVFEEIHEREVISIKDLSPEEADNKRANISSNVILEEILTEQLIKLNSFEYKGNSYDFSSVNIQGAVNALKNIPDEGLVRTNEKVYDLLTLGKSFTESIKGDQKSYTIK